MKDDLIKTYNLSKDDFWTHKQSGNLIITHKACEKIARQEKIVFDMPKILSSENNNVAILCSATWGDTTEWSIGEASPKTSFNIYYFAMAEKRVKDRLILKLIGVYGDVYSEDESDEFRRNNQSTPNVQQDTSGMNTINVPDSGDRSNKPFHPNAKGVINRIVDNGAMTISAWKETSERGHSYTSLKCREFSDNEDYKDQDEKNDEQQLNNDEPTNEDLDDEIPF